MKALLIIFSLSINICFGQSEAKPFKNLTYRTIKGAWFSTKTDSMLILTRARVFKNSEQWIFEREKGSKTEIENEVSAIPYFIKIAETQYKVTKRKKNELLLKPIDLGVAVTLDSTVVKRIANMGCSGYPPKQRRKTKKIPRPKKSCKQIKLIKP